MNAFCTIITPDYYPYALALYKSIRKYDSDISLWVLITGNTLPEGITERPGLRIVLTAELEDNFPLLQRIYTKYAHSNIDSFRWAAKPVFIIYLLEKGYSKILFADCDLFFFHDHAFLFEELEKSSVLLTPHWLNADPWTDEDNFVRNFTHGIFNAGFIGVSTKGLPVMNWWAEACHYKMGEHKNLGIHDDQKYLDILPAKFEDIGILRHKGCNISSLNRLILTGPKNTTTLLIEGIYPVVFAHFSTAALRNLQKTHEPGLLPYFNEFKRTFEEEGHSLSEYMANFSIPVSITLPMKIKWQIQLRTRIKRFLYNLAKSI